MTYSQLREEIIRILTEQPQPRFNKIMTAIDAYLEKKAVGVEQTETTANNENYIDGFMAGITRAVAIIRSKE